MLTNEGGIRRLVADMSDGELERLHEITSDEVRSRRAAREVASAVYRNGHMFGFIEYRAETPESTRPLSLVK